MLALPVDSDAKADVAVKPETKAPNVAAFAPPQAAE